MFTARCVLHSTFCPHSVFMCFVWIWEQTAIISLYSINWLVFINETACVYCAVRSTFYVLTTQCIYVFCMDLRTISASAANLQGDSYPRITPSQYTRMFRMWRCLSVSRSPKFPKTAVPYCSRLKTLRSFKASTIPTQGQGITPDTSVTPLREPPMFTTACTCPQTKLEISTPQTPHIPFRPLINNVNPPTPRSSKLSLYFFTKPNFDRIS